ncbi:MAG: biopolymer transporter ExbD [Phycisphaerales bacterium]
MNFTPKSKQRSTLLRSDLTAMIDIIFQLLIFFLLSTTYAPPEGHLEPAPPADHQEAPRPPPTSSRSSSKSRAAAGAPSSSSVRVEVPDKDSSSRSSQHSPSKEEFPVRSRQNNAQVSGAMAALQAARDAEFDKVTYVPPPQ